jgi:hypothetical protein
VGTGPRVASPHGRTGALRTGRRPARATPGAHHRTPRHQGWPAARTGVEPGRPASRGHVLRSDGRFGDAPDVGARRVRQAAAFADRPTGVRLVPSVAERYQAGRGRRDLEVWKPTRQAQQVEPGQTLRVLTSGPFALLWTADEWSTATRTTSTRTRLGLDFVDLRVRIDQEAPLRFTFLPMTGQQWEGQDHLVRVIRPASSR